MLQKAELDLGGQRDISAEVPGCVCGRDGPTGTELRCDTSATSAQGRGKAGWPELLTVCVLVS